MTCGCRPAAGGERSVGGPEPLISEVIIPRINTHYISGPSDELVFRAADAADLPDLVISGFDGDAQVWRWNVTPPGARAQQEVMLRIVVPVPGIAAVEVYARVSEAAGGNAAFGPPPKWNRPRLIARENTTGPSAIDPEWLAAGLRKAHADARGT